MKYTREILAYTIVLVFCWAVMNFPASFAETLKNLTIMAVGFYLGASKTGTDTAQRNSEIVGAAAATPSSVPTPVIVTNAEDQPVPTTDAPS